MARQGVTYEIVEAVAQAMEAASPGSATLRAVREQIGSGSSNTIQRHLAAWRENRPKAKVQPLTMPDEVMRVLAGWVVHASNAAKADADERAFQAHATADELARVGEALEAERDELHAELATITTQRDQALATAEERAVEIQRLLADISRERELTNAAQVDAAQVRHRADSQVDQLAELRLKVAELTAAIAVEQQSRTVAERDLAVAAAKLSDLIDERNHLREQIVEVQQDLVLNRDRMDMVRADADKRAAQDQQRLDKLRADLEERLATERDAVTKARAVAAAAAVEVAQLQERLKAAVATRDDE